MVFGLIIAASIVLLLSVVSATRIANGRTTTRVVTAEEFLMTYQKQERQPMQPKELLKHLQTGDETMKDLKRGSDGSDRPTAAPQESNMSVWADPNRLSFDPAMSMQEAAIRRSRADREREEMMRARMLDAQNAMSYYSQSVPISGLSTGTIDSATNTIWNDPSITRR